jgi:hypothetical protein
MAPPAPAPPASRARTRPNFRSCRFAAGENPMGSATVLKIKQAGSPPLAMASPLQHRIENCEQFPAISDNTSPTAQWSVRCASLDRLPSSTEKSSSLPFLQKDFRLLFLLPCSALLTCANQPIKLAVYRDSSCRPKRLAPSCRWKGDMGGELYGALPTIRCTT